MLLESLLLGVLLFFFKAFGFLACLFFGIFLSLECLFGSLFLCFFGITLRLFSLTLSLSRLVLCFLASLFTLLGLLVFSLTLFTLNLDFFHIYIVCSAVSPSVDDFGCFKDFVKSLYERNNLSEVKCPVVKGNAKRHNLTYSDFLFAVFVYDNNGLILNSTECNGTNLRRYDFKQARFASLLTVGRADI